MMNCRLLMVGMVLRVLCDNFVKMIASNHKGFRRGIVPLALLAFLTNFGIAQGSDTNLDAVFSRGGEADRVCLGDGGGGFDCSDVSASNTFSDGVALGDVDSDTLLDAVFATSSDGIFLCQGDNVGGFACNVILVGVGFGSGQIDVALGDVDGDTRLDAVFANRGGRITDGKPNDVCFGDSVGGFSCLVVSEDSAVSWGVALGDVDGDTFLDAVFANRDARNRVCLGDGGGGFTCSDVSTNSDFSRKVALGDVDGDTFLDAVFANSGARNRVCFGDGGGGFACSDVSTGSQNGAGVALGDVDGDTHLDAVFATTVFPRNQVCLGDGVGGFTCNDINLDFARSVALGDMNGDTNLDAVFGGVSGGLKSRVCLGDGGGSFTCSDVDESTSSFFLGVALGNLGGDIVVLDVDAIVPNKGGDTGEVSAVIRGRGFVEGATVKLQRNGEPDILGILLNVDFRSITATFDLTEKPRGLWDVVVEKTDGSSAALLDGFTIEEGRAAQVWVDIVGRGLIRLGRAQQYKIIYGNRGNIDADFTSLMIAGLPADSEVRVNFGYIVDPVMINDGDHSTLTPLLLGGEGGNVIPFQIRKIPPEFVGALTVEVTSAVSENFDLQVLSVAP